MPYFCVDMERQAGRDISVHDLSACSRLPTPENRFDLGFHPSWESAVAEARQYFPLSEGCRSCCKQHA